MRDVTVVPIRSPSSPTGVFVVKTYNGDGSFSLLWDREKEGSFPEAKDLKQRLRDKINPDLYLGHSDTLQNQSKKTESTTSQETVIDLSSNVSRHTGVLDGVQLNGAQFLSTPNVAITYCVGCRWLLRAAYHGQELMSSFDEKINSLTLIPSRPPNKGGAYQVVVTQSPELSSVLWDRFSEGRFPDTDELKERLSDAFHREKPSRKDHDQLDRVDDLRVDEMDDDEAAEARKYFGVF